MAECVLSLIVAETVQRSTNQDKQGYETGYRFVEQMSERRLGTAQRGCRLFQMEELIEVASPISGRELDPTLPPRCPALPFPRITHSPLVGGRAGPRRPPPADVSAYSRPGGWSTCGRVR